jgi:hypothetical protein
MLKEGPAICAVLLTVAGCGDKEQLPSSSNGFETFAVSTWAATSKSGSYLMQLSDADSSAACTAVMAPSSSPGIGSHALRLRIPADMIDTTGTFGCGIYCRFLVNGACSEPSAAELANNCAWYRRWDATGALDTHIMATGGTIDVTNSGTLLEVTLALQFPDGGSFADSFDLDRVGVAPWCRQ